MKMSDLYEYLFLGVDAIAVTLLYSLYRKRKTEIKIISEARSTSLDDLVRVLEKNGNEVSYMVLRGKVQAKNQTISSASGLKGVLQVISLNEHSVRRHAFGHWGDTVRTLNKTANTVPFYLASLEKAADESVLVEVQDPLSAEFENLLMPVSTNFAPTASSVAQTVMGFFTGQAAKGYETTEELLPVGAIITGIGKVSLGRNKQITLSHPASPSSTELPYILSTLPLDAILKRKEADNFFLKLAVITLASAGLTVFAFKIYRWWKIRKERKMRESILKVRESKELENLTEIETCVVCLRNPRELLIKHCGHVAVCADCCPKLNYKCPICRNYIAGTHPAYLS